VFRSSDDGDTWAPANDGLGNLIVRDLLVHGSDLLAATANGVFWSADSGVTWGSLTGDIINPNADGLAVSGSLLVVGTAYHGVSYRVYPGATLGAPAARPVALSLGTVAPDPLVGAASIEYGIPRAGRVRVTLCDVAGRKLATLFDGERPPGTHTVRLDASALRAGIYFCTLSTPDGRVTRRFAVVR
jgi:hypothetical protein